MTGQKRPFTTLLFHAVMVGAIHGSLHSWMEGASALVRFTCLCGMKIIAEGMLAGGSMFACAGAHYVKPGCVIDGLCAGG